MFEIEKLTNDNYKEKEIGVILKGKGFGWNRRGMHHIDAHYVAGEWIAAVDGEKTNVLLFGIDFKIFSVMYDLFLRTFLF